MKLAALGFGMKEKAKEFVAAGEIYLIGKLKRENVSALVKGDIELPTDISGVCTLTGIMPVRGKFAL